LSKNFARAELAKAKALELAEKLNLKGELEEIEAKLYEFKRSIIPKGLHVLGKNYSLEELKDFVLLLSRYERGEVKSLQRLIAEKKGLKLEELKVAELKALENEARKVVEEFLSGKSVDSALRKTLEYCVEVAKKFAENSAEIENLVKALEAGYIEPSTGGDVIRNPEALPTGRNLYQFDPLKVPTESATLRGKRIAEETLKRFFEKHGRYPESVAVILWGFETAQTNGETVAQIFEYLGVELVHKTAWEKEIRIKPLEELICGFFREMFPNVVELIEKAFKAVAELDESEEMNYVKKHGFGFRIFGPVATEYGTRMLQLVEDSAWQSEGELAEAYLSSMCYAYGKGVYGLEARKEFESLLKTVELVSQVRSSNDYEITDLDHYYEFFGGLAKAVETLSGKKAEMLIADSTKEEVKVESVAESIERGTVTRTLNPKWIEEMLKHGFLGVQKIADRIEYLLGLVLDEETFERLKELNVYATREILEKLLEAEKRGYWKAGDSKKKVEEKYLEVDGILEEVIV
jgi:cobaltochelatase CobN